MIIIRLGTVWILDGLEVTIVGNIDAVLNDIMCDALGAEADGVTTGRSPGCQGARWSPRRARRTPS